MPKRGGPSSRPAFEEKRERKRETEREREREERREEKREREEREKERKERERKTQREKDTQRPEIGVWVDISLPPLIPPQPCRSGAGHCHARPSKKKEGKKERDINFN